MKGTAAHSLAPCLKLGINAHDGEAAELFLPFREESDDRQGGRLKPFSAFGSFRQRHGDAVERNWRAVEAPVRLESTGCYRRGGLSQALSQREGEGNDRLERSMAQSDRLAIPQTCKSLSCLGKASHKGKSFSTDLDREEAWERKKEQYLLEEDGDCDDGDEYGADEGEYEETSEEDGGAESSPESDDGGMLYYGDAKGSVEQNLEHCEDNRDADRVLLDELHVDEGHSIDEVVKKASRRKAISRTKSMMRRPWKPVLRTRTKSLTDEDMEELRGSIDLGFGFSNSERCNLKSTLPALELYYAINKNYVDAQSRSSPESPLDGNALVRTNSAGSNALSPSREAWRVSSPGDHPSQVKTRLRHWAQAVACSLKQGY